MEAQLRNRFVTASVVLTALFFGATGAAQADDNFARLHKGAECSACHDTMPKSGIPQKMPNAKCEACHGPMDKIKLPPNKFEKDAHHSPHYADLLECTTCHAEHRASKNLCADCHILK